MQQSPIREKGILDTRIDILRLQNFKNYASADFDFGSDFNLIWGKNGMGKTNVLDAIYFMANLKSNMARRDLDLIKYGADFLRVESGIFVNGEHYHVVIGVDSNRKIYRIDDEKVEKRFEWLGRIPIWMIAPEDDEIIKDGSSVRRKMMDHLISLIDREYLMDLMTYNRLLKQRNAYLKNTPFSNLSRDFLITYSEQMQEPASRIVKKRALVSQSIQPFFNSTYSSIAQSHENIEFLYSSDLSEGTLLERHAVHLDKDLLLRRTSSGPHRDDWAFKIDQKKLKYFGSQGQKKTFILSVKLSLIQLYHQETNNNPILLLDDIFDKIDISRAEGLFEWLSKSCISQVIMTDTELNRSSEVFNRIGQDFRHYQVENGKLLNERNG